jgi:hypothetical protein
MFSDPEAKKAKQAKKAKRVVLASLVDDRNQKSKGR